ncbi:MAG: cadherin domain-containing protein [Alphaproteobacteria bacterium]
MATFTLTPGVDNFSGIAGQDNFYFFTPATLQATDTIAGAAGASFIDSMVLTASGTVTASQFAGVTGIEMIGLSSGGNTVSLTNGLVAGTGTGVFSVFGDVGNDTVDASGVTNGIRIVFTASSGTDSFIGGNGNDVFQFNAADLTSADSVNGGTGFDALALATGGTVAASAFTNVAGIEELLLSGAGNAVTLTNGLVGTSGPFVVYDGSGDDTIDASGVTNGTRVVFFATAGADTLRGGNGSDYFQFNAADLTAADTVNGGAGFDILAIGNGGTVAASAFTNVTSIEELLLSNAGNSVTLMNSLVGTNPFVVYDGTGSDTIDASGVTNGNRVVFFAGAGNDTLLGGNGSDVFAINTVDLTSGDTITGGAGLDILLLNTGGTVAASALANVTGIEELILSNAGNTVALTNGVVGTPGPFVVYDGTGNDVVDASLVTNGTRVVFNIGSGTDSMIGGSGNDFFAISTADLTAADTINGGAGSDFLQFTTTGIVTAASLAGVSGIESVGLLAGNAITLANTLTSAGSLDVFGTSGAETVDGSLVSGYDIVFHASGGADVLKGGSGNDAFLIPDSAFAQIDGGSGVNDRIVLSGVGQTLDVSANAAKISNIDVLWLDLSPSNNEIVTLTAADITAISGASNTLYVVGSSDDQVSAGSGWTLMNTGVTNATLAPGYTFNEYLNSNGATLFIGDQITASLTTSSNNPPDIELDGFPPDGISPPDGPDHTATYTTGNTNGVAIADVDARYMDADANGVNSRPDHLTVTLTNPHSNDATIREYFVLTAAGHTLAAAKNITITGENTATLTLTAPHNNSTHPTADDFQELLRDIRYVDTDVRPGQDYSARIIHVDAQDQGNGSNTAAQRTATINLTKGNIPPDAPIDNDGTANTVLENSPAGSSVGVTAHATDPDGDPVTYSLTDDASGRFTIDSGTGVVKLTGPLDFETDPHSYSITVQAADNHGGTSSASFSIALADANDNAPAFTSSATPSVAENTTAVVDLTTTDADTVGTNPPTFTITGGADQALFTIAGGNHLAFISAPDFENPGSAAASNVYDVQVTANDGANSTPQTLTVTVTDTNDVAPTFTSSATPSVAENTTAVVDLTTTDADTVGTNPPTFSITGGADSGLFTITGGNHLAFISAPDFENPGSAAASNVYDVQVTANDGVNSTPQNLTVTLTDTNDNAPTFTSSATPTVFENNTAVLDLTTTDPDTVGTNPPTFTITGGADSGLFTITGGNHLAFISAPDFENPTDSGTDNGYDVQVTADDGTNQTVQNITITVADNNDAPTLSATPTNPLYTPGVDLFDAVTASTIEGGQFIDQLVFTVSNVNDTDETMSIDGSPVALTDGTIVTPTAGNGMDVTVAVVGTTATVTISKAGGVDASIIAAIVDGMTYTDAAPAGGSRDVTITSLHDTGGNANGGNPTGTPNITSTITFDQPPTITAGATLNYTEDDGAKVIDNTIVVNDPDNANLQSATVKITGGFVSGEDVLSFTNTATITGSFVGDTLTLTGSDTLAAYQAALRSVTYTDTSQDPSGADRTITWTVNDGSLNNTTVATSTIHVTPVNDQPTLTATGLSPGFTENGSAVDLYSTVAASTIEAGQNLDQLILTVTNIAGTGATESLFIDGTTVELNNGNSETTATHGMTASVALAGGTATVTVSKSGGISSGDMQTLVDNLAYGNTSDDPGAASRVVTITSLRDTGSNAAPNDNINSTLVVQSTVAVTPVNDAPKLTATSVGGTFTEPPGSGLSAPTAGAVDLFSSPSASTIEAGQAFKQIKITVSNVADTTEFLNVSGTAVDLVNGNSESVTGGTASVVVAGGTATVTIDATTTFTAAQLNSLVDSLKYDNNDDTPTATSHTITITSLTDNGGTASGGVDTSSPGLSASVTVVATNDAPVAQNFDFSASAANDAIGNTSLVLDNGVAPSPPDPAGPQKTISGNLLTGATDVDGPGPLVTVSQNNVATTHGHVTINTSGEFSYTPAAGYTGTDTFTYQVSDQNTPTAGTGTGTVTVNVATPHVWYVNADAATDGDGTSASPFKTLSHFAGAGGVDHSGDIIFVYNATNHLTGGLTLESNEQLIGQDVGLTVNGTPLEAATGVNGAIIEGGVVLGIDNTISGVTLGNTGSGTALSGTSFGTLNVDHTVVNTDNNGMILSTGAFGAGAAFTSFTSGGATDVSLTSVTGSVDLGTGTMSGQFAVNGGSVNTTYAGNLSQANNAAMVDVSGGHSGTLTFNTGTLTATNGTGLQFNNADGTYNFNGTNTLNNSVGGANANAGINIVNSSDGTFSFSSNSSITNQTSGTAFNVSGGGGNITYAGTIGTTDSTTDNSGNTSVSVVNKTGGTVAFSGNILDSNDSGGGIGISGNANSTVNFSGTAKTLDTGIGDGVSITNNTGTSNVNFTNGGLTVQTSNGTAFQDTVAGTVTVVGSGNTLATSGTGAIVNMSDVSLGASGVTFGSLQSTGASVNTTAVLLNNVDGNTFTSGGTSIAGTSGAGNDGIRVSGGSSSTFNFNGTTTVSNTANDGINLSGANGAVSFNSVALNGMGGDGIDVSGNTNSVTVSGGSIGNTNDPAGKGVTVGSGTGNVSVAASITKTTAGHVADVSGHTGGTVTFSGNLSATGGVDNGIGVSSVTGGTYNFTGQTMALSTGTSTGVDLSGNTGGTINFNPTAGGNGLDITTSSGTGFKAVSASGTGATINVVQTGTSGTAGNTINSSTGTGLDIEHNTIGSSNVTFQSISSGGAANNGITLDTTGSSGGLHVTGDGSTAGSGGTIASKTGADASTTSGIGIYLNSTSNVQLNEMNLHDFQNFGIFGNTVNNFNLTNSTVNATASGTATNGTQQGSPNNEGSILFKELTGTANITNDTVADGITSDLDVHNNNSGSSLTLNVSGSTFTGRDSATLSATVQEVLLVAGANPGDTPTITANFTNNTMTNNDARDLQAVANGAAVMNINIGQNNVAGSGGNFNGMPAAALDLDHNSTGNYNFNVQNATFTTGNFNGQTGAGLPINIFNGSQSGAASTFQGRIVQSTINGGNNPGGGFDGIALTGSGPGTMTMLVDHNTVNNISAVGISYTGAQLSATNHTNLTITNNTVNMASNANDSFGIQVSGQASSSATSVVEANISGNTVTNDAASPDYRVDARFSSATFQMPGYAGGSQDLTAIKNFVAGNNGTTSTEVSASVGLAPGGNFTNTPGGAAVPLPNNPQPMLALDGGVASASVTPGEMNLTQSQLDTIVAAAINYWAAAGASADQIATLQHVTYTVGDAMAGWLAESTANHVLVDASANGNGWFVDPTPADSSEFANVVSATRAFTDPTTDAAGHMDLLTVVAHEMGEQLGLSEQWGTDAQDNIMSVFLQDGERRLPSLADAGLAQQQESSVVVQAAEAALPTGAAASAGTPIAPGGAGDDTFHIAQGGMIVVGGAGADAFVFDQAVLTAPAAQVTHIADYSAMQGDIIDVSAIVTLPPVMRGAPAPTDADMVRVAEDASGAFATLQVSNAGQWTAVAQLDGVHAGDAVNVVLDATHAQHQLHAAWLA